MENIINMYFFPAVVYIWAVVRDLMDFAVKINAGIQHSVSVVKENVIADNRCAIS